jgi:mono/diheme cytochrome c family protein
MRDSPFVRLLLIVGWLFTSLSTAQNTSTPQGNADKGKQTYIKNGCYSCHGYDGHGGVAPKLAPRPIPTVAFIAIVRHPPPSGMPTYSQKVASDSDLTDVWAYLKSIPDPPQVKNLSQLNQ